VSEYGSVAGSECDPSDMTTGMMSSMRPGKVDYMKRAWTPPDKSTGETSPVRRMTINQAWGVPLTPLTPRSSMSLDGLPAGPPSPVQPRRSPIPLQKPQTKARMILSWLAYTPMPKECLKIDEEPICDVTDTDTDATKISLSELVTSSLATGSTPAAGNAPSETGNAALNILPQFEKATLKPLRRINSCPAGFLGIANCPGGLHMGPGGLHRGPKKRYSEINMLIPDYI